jgi:hypothetical protein
MGPLRFAFVPLSERALGQRDHEYEQRGRGKGDWAGRCEQERSSWKPLRRISQASRSFAGMPKSQASA